ncbi:kelch domain-containing protein 4 [Culicoides brevitarsis]|uniref:kelch domain-containing protein 4 n=1 Tax=Culicoides brevitarsis TaxID=469753 RepID=UPI00307C59AB
MGKKDKNKKKGKGAEKTLVKTDKKLVAKNKKLLQKLGEEDIQDIIAKQEQELSQVKTVELSPVAPPSARSSFGLTSFKDDMIMFGGEFFNGQKTEVYGDFYFFNTVKNEWKLVKAKGPTPRSGAALCSVETDGGQLWLFGGEYQSPSQIQIIHFKDLWVYRLKTKVWEKVNAPNGPTARSGHRMVASKKKLFVFGGFYDNNATYKYYNDLFVFSLETYTWLNIQVSGNAPSPRSGICFAAANDGKIVVWGGFSKSPVKKGIDRGVTHGDMFTLVPEKGDTTGLKYKWNLVKPGGSKPLPRSGMSIAVAANGKCYNFGGVLDTKEDEEDIEGQFGNDLHCLDLSTLVWRRMELNKKSSEPKKTEMEVEPVEEVKTVTNELGFTVTVGGPSTKTSSAKSESNEGQNKGFPSPRMNAGIVVINKNLYLYGGIYEQGHRQYTLSDFYSLDVNKMDSWKTLIANSNTQEWVGSDSEGSSDEDDDEEDDDDDDEEESGVSDEDSDESDDMETD